MKVRSHVESIEYAETVQVLPKAIVLSCFETTKSAETEQVLSKMKVRSHVESIEYAETVQALSTMKVLSCSATIKSAETV